MNIVDKLKLNKILYVVGQNIHIDVFIKDAEQWNHDISNYTFICWNSYKKHYGEEFDLIVADEADLSSSAHIKGFQNIKSKKIILLTATMDTDTLMLYNEYKKFYKWSIDIKTAIKFGILPKPTIYVKRIIPNKIEDKQLEKINSAIKNYYEKGNTFMCKREGLKRKQLFEQIKMNWFEKDKIFERLKTKRTIFFLPDIKKSALLGNSVSSLENKKENQRLLEDYNNGIIDYLISNKILIRGVSLFNVKYAVIISLDLKVGGTTTQKFGRVLLDNASSVIFAYVANTKEEVVVNKFIESLDGEIKYL
jgi:superfamily II DNA or RNA helicase